MEAQIMTRWRHALATARTLFERDGHPTAPLDEIERCLRGRSVRPEQLWFWQWISARPLQRADVERFGVEFISTPNRLNEVARGCHSATLLDVGYGLLTGAAALLFTDDEGRVVAYAPAEMVAQAAR